jgi:ATP-dependent Clp protease adapter protein ClpS
MRPLPVQADYLQLVIYDDDQTPQDFVVGLVRSVFGQSSNDANSVMATVERRGKAVCGTYPRAVAEVLFQTAQQRIEVSGHSLLITAEAGDDAGGNSCKLCGDFAGENQVRLAGKTAAICDDCTLAVADNVADISRTKQFRFVSEALEWHFAGVPDDQMVATSRQFPGHMRADVQTAIDNLFSAAPIRFFGIHERHRYETLTFSALGKYGEVAHGIAPAQYYDVDIGETEPVKCLHNGLWLCIVDELRYAVLLSAHREYDQETGVRVEISVPAGAIGAAFVKRCFSELENAVNTARAYRGKVLSFDADSNYRGSSRGLMVHKLPPVRRENVILPEATLKLLDRNVLNFVGNRAQLRKLGQSTRKGILLYGPPGTGKTHTIRYLASNLPGHTTLIITAAQVALLGAYMSLARLLQPVMVVIEDVDLIARSRERMGGPCEESLLNKLLNEMDGLKEDADILFVLTTNRPEQLENALANRPGRIDQAIEIPLPDDIGRKQLVQLYGKGLPLGDTLVNEAARRTKGVSAAFIKELMRRIAQASISRDGGTTIAPADLGEALDHMLFASGKLNIKLLGGAQEMAAG